MTKPLAILLLAACSSHKDVAPAHLDAAIAIDAPSPPPIDAAPDAPLARWVCNRPAPEGAPTPTPPPTYPSCPTLVAGLNTITSSMTTRTFMLVLPAVPQVGEKLPVLFLWYWLGGSAQGFIDRAEVQQAVDDQRFIAVVPVAIGATVFPTSFNTKWPFDITQSPARMNQEFTFFDDMLSCVEQQFPVNQSCVSTVGVSAGALFTDQLAQARSQTLASFISLSGGVGATIIKPWVGASHKLPALVMWGGDGPPTMDGIKDILGCFGVGMDFSVASRALEAGLVQGGQFFVECKHNCGHVEPPLQPPPGESKYAAIWRFAFDHPFWLPAGQSPWLTNGLPSDAPAWCGIGANSATPRSGSGCPPPENPCVSLQ